MNLLFQLPSWILFVTLFILTKYSKVYISTQTLEAELAAKVEALSKDRVALSIENKKLKWQLLNLHQEKIRKDCK